MTSNPDPPSSTFARPGLGWIAPGLALGWIVLIRVPLILNAPGHLDSDLAVDGLTLIDALQGHWRWHYPATPFIGSPPVLLSSLQAKVWGPTPGALVSGGVVAYGLVVVAAYLLSRRAFGPSAARWGLVPLAFASTGVVWLSGRVTGGHLLAACWHAGAFLLLWEALTRGGWRRSAALGFWAGFGLYVDSMVGVTWAGLGVAAVAFAGLAKGDDRPGTGRVAACLLAFAVAGGVGLAPRLVGKWADPHDAYVGQFEPIARPDHLARNARILLLDCLPRLAAGHRLPGLQAEPEIAGANPPKGVPWLALAATVAGVGSLGWSLWALARGPVGESDPARLAIRLGLLASGLAVVAGFLVYPSIANSDHYRYLVTLLVPWSSGFGLAMAGLAARRRVAAWALMIGLAVLMTADTRAWYGRLGWVDPAGRPVRKAGGDLAVAWLDAHPEVSTVLGDYWDVYRLAFLTGGRVRAVPFPMYPDRFPEAGRALPGSAHPVVIVRPGPFGPIYRGRALAAGGRELLREPGLSIVEWPGGMTP